MCMCIYIYIYIYTYIYTYTHNIFYHNTPAVPPARSSPVVLNDLILRHYYNNDNIYIYIYMHIYQLIIISHSIKPRLSPPQGARPECLHGRGGERLIIRYITIYL